MKHLILLLFLPSFLCAQSGSISNTIALGGNLGSGEGLQNQIEGTMTVGIINNTGAVANNVKFVQTSATITSSYGAWIHSPTLIFTTRSALPDDDLADGASGHFQLQYRWTNNIIHNRPNDPHPNYYSHPYEGDPWNMDGTTLTINGNLLVSNAVVKTYSLTINMTGGVGSASGSNTVTGIDFTSNDDMYLGNDPANVQTLAIWRISGTTFDETPPAIAIKVGTESPIDMGFSIVGHQLGQEWSLLYSPPYSVNGDKHGVTYSWTVDGITVASGTTPDYVETGDPPEGNPFDLEHTGIIIPPDDDTYDPPTTDPDQDEWVPPDNGAGNPAGSSGNPTTEFMTKGDYYDAVRKALGDSQDAQWADVAGGSYEGVPGLDQLTDSSGSSQASADGFGDSLGSAWGSHDGVAQDLKTLIPGVNPLPSVSGTVSSFNFTLPILGSGVIDLTPYLSYVDIIRNLLLLIITVMGSYFVVRIIRGSFADNA